MEIKFCIPFNEVVPTELRITVDNIAVQYEHNGNSFIFWIADTYTEERVKEIINAIVDQIKFDHNTCSDYSFNWETISLEYIHVLRYGLWKAIWKYEVKDSY